MATILLVGVDLFFRGKLEAILAGALFTRAMGAFRWLRDHYQAIQIGSGAIMVALGLMLFFGRFYVLRIYVNRALEWLGLEPVF